MLIQVKERRDRRTPAATTDIMYMLSLKSNPSFISQMAIAIRKVGMKNAGKALCA
jgi:hypothetical protein